MEMPVPESEPVPGGERLENLFWRLSRLRSHGFAGPESLQPGLIRDWSATTGRPLRAAEVEMLLEMDGSYLQACQRELQAGATEEEELDDD